ncbi:MAG TPA: M20/M25/M40 family metallo-hydrolase [Clostridiales bacterium]|nr:M20/M25/M40 family metallo-hydrolase [Clostridiales bacterium]HQP69522.1 M20/M25/M40 family metallo-hydrolase [Clostridiales bacterium]
MDKNSKKFLLELLNTPSPSGYENDIQRKWMSYVKNFADRVETDIGGNAIAILNPGAKMKVLLAGHCDEIGFIINRIDDNGFIYFGPVGGISHKIASGLKVEILGEKEKIKGVIGVNAEHHGGLKEKFEYEDLYIDCGFKDRKEALKKVRTGDFAVYYTEPMELFNGKISSKGLDDKTGCFIVAEVIKKLSGKKFNAGVYSVSTTSEEIGLQGAYFAAAGIEPSMAIVCDVTFATDYPGVNTSKYGEYKIGGGPVLAKGSPINKKINSLLFKAAEEIKCDVQIELTPKITGTDADRIRFTNRGVPVALVSLPLRYMHSPVETASYSDIEKTIDLICRFILSLTGKENFKPLE